VTYTPDIRDYQQLHSGDPHGGVNCTAWCGAILVDANSGGKVTTTGEAIRKATNEPIPDPVSPGLNLPQVDAAINKLLKVDFDTRLGDPILDAETRIKAGRYAIVQVIRGVLVDHGFAGTNGFRGGHAITVHVQPGDDTPIILEPLVPYAIRASWGAIWAAAAGIAGSGRANVMFTRDLIPEYAVTIEPTEGHVRREFRTFIVHGGVIVRRDLATTKGFTSPCTPPKFHPWKGHVGRSLVQVLHDPTSKINAHEGQWVLSHWSHER
jgi:hypothetical protein